MLCRPPYGSPHMRHRAIVEAQTFFRLLEMASDNVRKGLPGHLGIRVEGIDIMHGDHARGHVPFVISGTLVFFLDVIVRFVIGPEMALSD